MFDVVLTICLMLFVVIMFFLLGFLAGVAYHIHFGD